MSDRDLLAGRGVVVVGGSRGIGRAVAELLARRGAGVVISGREPDAVHDATEAVISAGGRATGIAGAADHEDTANALVDRCMTSFGRLDALINCAGIAEPPGSSILNISPAQFDGLLRAHLGTVFHTCRVAAPVLAAQGHGSIINTGSVAFLGDYGGSGYPAGKAAVNGLTLAISAELKARGVRANVICPGARTRLSSGPDYEAHINELHRRGLLDEMTRQASLDAPPADFVAPLYAYLASDLASGITGQIFVASGGFVGTFDRPTPQVLGWRDHRADPQWPVEDLHTMINARPLDTD
ncbi:3-oxoacyl-[acyl-carrier-protein] reductase FabG [Mycobacterium marinum]|uniref:SDR family NAD(P)-dependent oxidoreductase n=1 Tax=Mycobacterium marinum TaxID=1781 RepID=UPI000358DAA0|nr:SDR family oxidoreductase [Mycobacterium marinum]AXN49940.1 3-oxoacyl-[acyl-carrier-protein] reductase FabG [Mycobacterium marinum]EPQ80276.1 Short-chain dehydrogenase/reductase SDR [Mycobacterium marinum str. Europe]RFZ04816.1 3-oxoacyl-[acyl-carrier-protein] reductase FabG [Mycobacterium marinum]RFZ21487.1 3-oxoacyl-[acyl-carrier-protein] reductase FabG [Mycobacterium marinum]RFZ27425.1 3-oxoacyl-[acyl-carrier-protein] reductase FabG [Mycobacterium marinum]